VTHNSLAATQRAHISLIDRRHFWPRRVAHRALPHPHAAHEAVDLTRPLTALSHINVRSHRCAARVRVGCAVMPQMRDDLPSPGKPRPPDGT
jgi:hypothetical protein